MSATSMETPPDWFWDVLQSTSPSLKALEAWLVNVPKERVEQFASAYELAAQSLCDYWNGPIVDGVQYSEDDTEDVCNWIVSQGPGLWQRVFTGELDLERVAKIIFNGHFHLLPEPVIEWSEDVADPAHDGYQDPALIAAGVFYSRFGELYGGN
ncbi:MAG: hypothetical protein R3C53_15625 [Pirellulaceae bacterium]